MTLLKSSIAISMGCASLLFSLLAYAAAPLEF